MMPPFTQDATEEQLAGCQAKADAFVEMLRRGESWFPCLLHTIAEWSIPVETWRERRYPYLIGGEAFDWLLLAERLLDEASDLVSEDERARLLFDGEPPMPLDSDLFREMIGPQKHSAHLNYLYGIIVEEALQQAVLEEAAKDGQGHSVRENSLEEEAFRRLYDTSPVDLHTEFRRTNDSNLSTATSLEELRSFTYWLFKRRVARSDPARLASDTRKGLRVLEQLRPGAWHWTQGEAVHPPN
jgi:hypothetical protein